MTDIEGRLELDSLLRQGDTLEIRSLGFGTRSMAMPGPALDLEVQLAPESVNLLEVVVAVSEPSRQTMGTTTVSHLSAASIAQEVPANAATLFWNSGQVMVQQSQQGGGSPILRGFEANRILLVVDGVRLNNAIYRSGHLQNAHRRPLRSSVLSKSAMAPVPCSTAAMRWAASSITTRSPRWEDGARARAQTAFSAASRAPTFHADAEVTRGRFASFTSVTHRRYGDVRMGRWRPHGYADWGVVPWSISSSGTGAAYADRAESNGVEHLQPGTGYHQTDVVQKLRYGRMERHLEVNLQHSTSSDVPRFDRLNDSARQMGDEMGRMESGPQDRTLASLRFRTQVRGLAGCPSRRLGSAWPRAGSRPASASRTGRCKRKGSMWPACNWTSTTGWAHGRWLMGALGPSPRPIGSVDGAPIRWVAPGGPGLDPIPQRGRRWGRSRPTVRLPGGGGVGISKALPAPNGGGWMPASKISRAFSCRLTGSDTSGAPSLEVPPPVGSGMAGVGAHGQLATAFRNPNVDDVGKVRAKDGFVVIPTDSLRPERLFSAELGGFWRSSNRRLTTQWSGFATALRDAIQPVDTVLTCLGWGSIHPGGGGRHQPDSNAGQPGQGFDCRPPRASGLQDGPRLAIPGDLQRDLGSGCRRSSFVPHSARLRDVHGFQSWTWLTLDTPAVERMETRRRLRAGRYGQPGGGHGGRDAGVVDDGL